MKQTKQQMMEVAQTINSQLEQNDFFKVIKVDQKIATTDGLMLKLKKTNGINTVIIKYNYGTDLYDLEFWNCSTLPQLILDKVSSDNGFYWEQLPDAIALQLQERRK